MKHYKIIIEDVDDSSRKIEWYGSLHVVFNMLSCEPCTCKNVDAKTMEEFTIFQKVFDALKVDVSALDGVDFEFPKTTISKTNKH